MTACGQICHGTFVGDKYRWDEKTAAMLPLMGSF